MKIWRKRLLTESVNDEAVYRTALASLGVLNKSIIILLRIEPRAAAYAERLWRGPLTSSNWVEAERRLVIHRERIARRGVTADSMTHGWCR